MNKLLVICSLLFLQNVATQEEKTVANELIHYEAMASLEGLFVSNARENNLTDLKFPYELTKEKELNLSTINYIEEEQVVDLGFDTEKYLPKGFNPYEVYFDIHSIEYIEEEEEINLGFDTEKYLPENFDPYAIPMESILYIEKDEEEIIDLGFDTKKYLPKGFNPHAKPSIM
ncbi:hypothetical protein [Leptobacterium sp. I13]|uniref:hypothetical protein n=1 Tax=Leptobacterium meishanense TaxID=3128904 RepID=UPI0030EB1D66